MAINNSPRRALKSLDPRVNMVGVRFPVSSTYVKAELDMSSCNAQMDNVLEATTPGVAGNSIRVKVVGDSAAAAGVTIDVSGNDVTIHFEDGVSTQGDVNTAIAALSGADDIIGVKTAGTTATVLVAGRAYIDMDTAFDDADSVVKAGFLTGADGTGYVVMAVPDGTGAGSIDVVDFGPKKALVYHFEDGVSTVTNFETALAALAAPADFELKTDGTGATTFDDPGDAVQDTMESGTDTNAEQDFESLSGGTGFGAVAPTGDTDWIESITHTAVGTYLVTLDERWPQLLGAKAAFQSGTATAYQAKVGTYTAASRTLVVFVWDTNGAALADPTPAAGTQVGLLLELGNSGVGRCA